MLEYREPEAMVNTHYTTGQAAERLGIRVATLRQWIQRYDLFPDRDRGAWLKLTEEDLEFLKMVRDGTSSPREAVGRLSKITGRKTNTNVAVFDKHTMKTHS